MGNLDRLIRVMLAATIGALYFKGVVTGLLGTILLILAVVFVLVSLVGFVLCTLFLDSVHVRIPDLGNIQVLSFYCK